MDLIGSVRPEGGWYALLAIKDRKIVRQILFETRSEFDEKAKSLCDDGWDVYFGLGKFKDGDEGRVANNVSHMKAFFVDIDCGETKAIVNEQTGRPDGYATQVDGLNALNAFCADTGLPIPTIVNSGNGVHAYWPLDKEVTREEWKPIAETFKKLIADKEFYTDPAVPADAARVLRIPGTYNFRYGKKEVLVKHELAPISIEEFSSKIGYDAEKQKEKPKKRVSPLAELLKDNLDSSFSKIIVRSAKGNGCAQLLDCYQNRETLSEPRWFNALSIAKTCVDRNTAIHKLSEGHPDYDYELVEQKANHIKGPHPCTAFEENNPGGCDGCPHKGKITNPLVLGKQANTPTEVEVVIQQDKRSTEQEEEEEQYWLDSGPEVVKIPPYPWPFTRGKNGGIYFSDPEDEDSIPKLIYERDLYVVKRMVDITHGDCLVLRLILPKDGLREFILSNMDLVDKSELRKKLASQGVMLTDERKFPYLAKYLNASVLGLQEEKAEMMRPQFGWADGDRVFVIGDREIAHDGVSHSPPSPTNEVLSGYMQPKGTFKEWKQVFDLYGLEGMEPEAFAALTAFGAPLFKFTGHSGALINLISSESGTGKTTILRMIASVYGHPKLLCASFNDTMAAKMHQLGTMNNICVSFDEITNMDAKSFSHLCYAVSQGRGAHRMEGATNKLRNNNTTWQNICAASSNASFFEKLSSIKNKPEGEMMRLFEYEIEPKDILAKEEARNLFDHQLLENYGHAGLRYMMWVVPNLDIAKSYIKDAQNRLDSYIGLNSSERFWSAIVACNIAGGVIAKDLGLIDWDIKRLFFWAVDQIKKMRQQTAPPTQDVMQVVYDYLLRNQDKILVVDDGVDNRTKRPSAPRIEPRGQLVARIEPDTEHLWLLSAAFKKDCITMQESYSKTLDRLKASGRFVETKPKRLSKGMTTDIGIGVVQSLCIDISGSSILNSTLLDPEDSDESRED